MRLSAMFYFLIFFKADTSHARAYAFARRRNPVVVSTLTLQKKLYTERQYWRVERLAATQNARIG
jgi:hypothetical protein